MGFNFKKSFGSKHFKINIGKKGISSGTIKIAKGITYNTKRGVTLGVPETGLSYNINKSKENSKKQNANINSNNNSNSNSKIKLIVLWIILFLFLFTPLMPIILILLFFTTIKIIKKKQ